MVYINKKSSIYRGIYRKFFCISEFLTGSDDMEFAVFPGKHPQRLSWEEISIANLWLFVAYLARLR